MKCQLNQTLGFCSEYFTEVLRRPFADIFPIHHSQPKNFSRPIYADHCLIPERDSPRLIWVVLRYYWRRNIGGMRTLFLIAIPIGLCAWIGNLISLISYSRRLGEVPIFGDSISLIIIDMLSLILTGTYGIIAAFLRPHQSRAFCFRGNSRRFGFVHQQLLPLMVDAAVNLEAIMWGSLCTANCLLVTLCLGNYCSQMVAAAAETAHRPWPSLSIFSAKNYGKRIFLSNLISYGLGYGSALMLIRKSVVYRMRGRKLAEYGAFCFWLSKNPQKQYPAEGLKTPGGGVSVRDEFLEYIGIKGGREYKKFYKTHLHRSMPECSTEAVEFHRQMIFLSCILTAYLFVVIACFLLYRQNTQANKKDQSQVQMQQSVLPSTVGGVVNHGFPVGEISDSKTAGSVVVDDFRSSNSAVINGDDKQQKKANFSSLEEEKEEKKEVHRRFFLRTVITILYLEAFFASCQLMIGVSSVAIELINDARSRPNKYRRIQMVVEGLTVLCYICQCSVNFLVFLEPGRVFNKFSGNLKRFLRRLPPWNSE